MLLKYRLIDVREGVRLKTKLRDMCDMCVMLCYVMCYVIKILGKKGLVTMNN